MRLLFFLLTALSLHACTWDAKSKTWSCAASQTYSMPGYTCALASDGWLKCRSTTSTIPDVSDGGRPFIHTTAPSFQLAETAAPGSEGVTIPMHGMDCIAAPCSGSTNFPRDLYGPEDTRNLTWGHADSATLPIKFNPPAGYRVKILSIQGDLVSWPKVMPGEPPVSADRYAGVLIGFSTTEAEGSTRADYLADNCLLYAQDAIHGGEKALTKFKLKHIDRVLPDGVLNLKIAAWLNSTGYAIHEEATVSRIRYRFVPE